MYNYNNFIKILIENIILFWFQILFKNYIQDYNTKVRKGNEVCIKKIVIAFAGPLVNIFIAIIAFFMPQNMAISKETLIYANLMLTMFNLLPIYPLDGGRILKEIVAETDIDVEFIDVEENPDATTAFGIRSIPTIMYYQNEKLIDTTIGALTKEDILKRFKE